MSPLTYVILKKKKMIARENRTMDMWARDNASGLYPD